MAGFNADLLIEPDVLAEGLGTGEYRIVDARGAAEFVRGHLPDAVHLPITKLQDPLSERGALLPFEEIRSNIGAAGIEPDSTLVLYDDSGLVPSARWFWILEKFGHKNVKLLNGGIIRWKELGLPLERGEPDPESKTYIAEIQEGIVADKSDVYAAI
ncbi:MAG: hypothetical protein MI724_17230, partial [Spirochaetales bacterium]|nr:hypothetical protein [Spirochaetales bacterium]